MGKPEDLEKFTMFPVQDIIFYIDNEVLKEHLDKNKLLINIEGYGRQQFEIEE
jgi:hypothetical protein